MRVIVTGSRYWNQTDAVHWHSDGDRILPTVIQALPPGSTVVHGGARGADREAGYWAELFGHEVEVFHAEWEKYGKRAGMIRNQDMVGGGADLVVAFPLGESRGTRDCMRRAEAAGIPVLNFGEHDDD